MTGRLELERRVLDVEVLHGVLDEIEDRRTRIELADRVAELGTRQPIDLDRAEEVSFS